MITAGKFNLMVQAGESYAKQFKLMQANNEPFDLTDYTIKAWIKTQPSDTTAVTVFTGSALAPTEGVLQISLPPSSSMLLTSSCYFYDIRISSGSTTVLYPLEGKVLVSPSITK